jgi:hypothetical protein
MPRPTKECDGGDICEGVNALKVGQVIEVLKHSTLTLQ